MLRRSRLMSSPDSSQKPMARVMVITRPRGAKPEKLLTKWVKSQFTPSLENRFWDMTSFPVAGFSRATPEAVRPAPISAVIKNKMQNRMAGGGSLAQTRSTPFKNRSTQGVLGDAFPSAIPHSSFPCRFALPCCVTNYGVTVFYYCS